MTYFVRAPHPPSERQTDAGQLPPWLLGVAFSPPLFPTSTRVRVGDVILNVSGSEPASPICSAKGCRADAVWVLAWDPVKQELREVWRGSALARPLLDF